MAYRTLTLLALALQACNVYAAGKGCSANSLLKTCASVKAYCSSHYPVAPVVSTATTHVSATTTVTNTVTTTSTAHVTSTSTITDTTITETATVTAGSKKLRKRAKVPPCQSAYSSVTKQGAAAQKSICSCIETPATSTTTTTVYNIQTAHTTVTSTAKRTATDQATTHVTATTTTTTTVQPAPTGPPCSSGPYTAGGNAFNVECGTNITTSDNILQNGQKDNVDVCISSCNTQASQGVNQAICAAYFKRDTGDCTCYTRNTISTPSCHSSFSDAASDYDTAILSSNGGGTGSGPACSNGPYTAGKLTFTVSCGTNITTTDNMVADGTADNVDVCASNCQSKYASVTNVDTALCAVWYQRDSGSCTCYGRNTVSSSSCHSSFGDADANHDTAVVQSSS